jgi:hypothetical protein
MNALFSTTKPNNSGLTNKGLSGTMDWDAVSEIYRAAGIPVVPINDSSLSINQPYQQAIVIAKSAGGTIIAGTRATIPTSDEINCAKCHGTGSIASAFDSIISDHSEDLPVTPILCASCHSSPALSTPLVDSIPYLSEAIHGFHADKNALCLDCHPGVTTRCNRSLAHTATDGNCINCHGTMENVSTSISAGRTPWEEETKCSDCHTSYLSNTLTTAVTGSTSSITEVDTFPELYRNAEGHGGVRCTACHGSPHAMVPSREEKDNYQAMDYQNASVTIGSCAACHNRSHGEGAREFIEKHGGSNPDEYSACNVCHTAVHSGNISLWPHDFLWKSR